MTAKSRSPKPKHPQVLNPGSVIRMEVPKSSRHQPKAHIIVSAPEPVSGFRTFLREHAVIALAIGFVVATQIQALAKQLIASFIDPAFKLMFGEKLSLRTFTLHFHGRTADFGYGSFIYALLDVLFVLITIYIAVRIFRLEDLGIPDKNKKKKKSAVEVENEEY